MVTFWGAFFQVLRWRPHQALAGLYWHVTGRKVRARNRLRLALALAPHAYERWIKVVENHSALRSGAAAIAKGWSTSPKFSIVLYAPTGAVSDKVQRTVASIKEQLYSNWELIVAGNHDDQLGQMPADDRRVIALSVPVHDEGSALEFGIAHASGDFLIPLGAGDLLSPAALFRFAEALQGEERPSILYGDQDEIDLRGKRSRPWFKPEWDEEMFLAQDCVSSACAVDIRLARAVLSIVETSGDAATYAFLLAATKAAPGSIVHLPFVLCHVAEGAKRSNQAARVAAVERHLKPHGATAALGPFDTVKVKWPLPERLPAVTVIIPTRDKASLLRACVESVLVATLYPDFEILIVDNGSTEVSALSYLEEIARHPLVRVIGYDQPYNYSAINNFAAAHATTPYLCLLNNDTEVMTPEWLTEMMRYAVRPEIGAVGAKLLYGDGTIQHAGVVVGICEAAGHAHRFVRSDEPGYFGQPHLTHIVSAVTAACLVVEKAKFDAVGGLDAGELAVAFNDVDFCLKIEQAGWHNMYVPHAVLLHHESKSRGLDTSPKKRDRFLRELATLQERWGTKTYADPRHNFNLDRHSETFILRL